MSCCRSRLLRAKREISSCAANRTHLAKAELGDHPVETGACGAASGRVTETVIDRLHGGPAERRQVVVHCMLKHTALAIVQNPMGAQPPARFFREPPATRHRSRLRGGLMENRSNWGVVSWRAWDTHTVLTALRTGDACRLVGSVGALPGTGT